MDVDLWAGNQFTRGAKYSAKLRLHIRFTMCSMSIGIEPNNFICMSIGCAKHARARHLWLTNTNWWPLWIRGHVLPYHSDLLFIAIWNLDVVTVLWPVVKTIQCDSSLRVLNVDSRSHEFGCFCIQRNNILLAHGQTSPLINWPKKRCAKTCKVTNWTFILRTPYSQKRIKN